jgi:predicted  nucleic acid-binding Zn-ribbon protein
MVSSVISDISTGTRIQLWRLALMLTTEKLREKIELLKSEKVKLRKEVDTLRTEAEGKAIALECEVAVLREEADSLKQMLKSF